MSHLGPSVGWGLVIAASLAGGVMAAAVPEADSDAGVVLTALGRLGGALVQVGADARLNRDEKMKMTRRSMREAAAGRAMEMSRKQAEAARGESIAVGRARGGFDRRHPARLRGGEQPGRHGHRGGLHRRLLLS